MVACAALDTRLRYWRYETYVSNPEETDHAPHRPPRRKTAPRCYVTKPHTHGVTNVVIKLASLACIVLLGAPALAQSNQSAVREFLAPVQQNAALRAAQASVSAAQNQLGAAYSPVALEATGGYSTFNNDPIDLSPEAPGVQGLPGSGAQLAADVSFRPILFGDTADLADQLRLELERAQLSYSETLASLQRRALEAALGVQLAENSQVLAQEGADLAATALSATRTRFERGAANVRGVRDAEANLQEAQNFAQQAAADLRLAQLNLQSLVGDATLAEIPTLPTVEGTPLEVRRAALNVSLAEIAPRSTARGLYPVVQAGYNWNVDDRSSLNVSLESRTLQPSVGYSYQDPSRALPESAQNGSFQVGISVSISPGTFEQLSAAQDQVSAAQAGLRAAQDGAALQQASLTSDQTQAEQTLALKELQFRNAQQNVDEARQRETLGISTPLETQTELIDLLQADLELRTARQSVLSSTLASYEFYGIPVTEVLE